MGNLFRFGLWGLSAGASVLGTLTLMVLVLASMPNSKPASLRNLKLLLLISLLLGAGSLAAAICLMRNGSPLWGSLAATPPLILLVGFFRRG